MSFTLEKQNALTKKDKSHEQQWDEKIKSLCDKINAKENFFTTSSCAGRITIIKDAPAAEGRTERCKSQKSPDAFLFKSHDKITFNQIKETIQNIKDKAYFRQEPCALHVACKTLQNAQSFLNKARAVGWKKSGIISSDKRFICELFSTELIATPITEDLSQDYLELLIEEANKKLERTWGKIDRLMEVI